MLAADTRDLADRNLRLVDLVRHEVVPAIREALAVTVPVLLTDAAPLARYRQLEVLQELTDINRPPAGGPAATGAGAAARSG